MESYFFVQTIEPPADPNYSAHDFRRISAHYGTRSFSKVKPGTKVITIEPTADALSLEEVVKLFSTSFEQTCTLKVI